MPVLPIPATAAGSSSIHLINILPATLYATPPASASSLESKADKLEKEEVQGVELKDAVEDVFPEGGLSAYLAVCGSFLIIGATFGLSNCYGVLQAYFSLNQLQDYPPAQISLIGSVHIFMIFASGIMSGKMFDKGWFRYQIIGGSLTWLAGIFGLSFSQSYTAIFFTYSIVAGLGLGNLFAPAVAIISTYFKDHRVFFMGIGSAGASITAVIFPILLNSYLPIIGFASAIRMLGYIMLVMLGVANLIMKPRILPKREMTSPPAPVWSFFKETATWLHGSGVFFVTLGLFVPLFYFQLYALSLEGSVSPYIIKYNLAFVNAGATIMRIAIGWIADRYGILNTSIPTAFVTGALGLTMLSARNDASSLVFLLLYGGASGAWASCFSSLFQSLAQDSHQLGARTGVGFIFISISNLIGNPFAGFLLRSTGSFLAPVLFAGVCMILGSGFLLAARPEQVRRRNGWKV